MTFIEEIVISFEEITTHLAFVLLRVATDRATDIEQIFTFSLEYLEARRCHVQIFYIHI
tara:strand:+ start:64 stop:240 length:177 start_codon:yes stop_codon:yes gene_type:complete